MTKRVEDLFDDFAEDFLGENSSRIIIIIGASKIDDSLAEIITKGLLPKLAGDNEQDELLEGDSPLTTFSSRIKISYRLGFIDSTLYRVLEKIRKIRNIGAHQLSFDIDSSPLREHVSDLFKLVENRKSFILTRERYFQGDLETDIEKLKCEILSICVILQVAKSKIKKPRIQNSIHKITSN
jgi:hypothetical protein